MIADFYETFDESPNKGSDIPQEVLNILSEELPSSFMYYRDNDGVYMAGPRPEHASDAVVLKVDIDKDFIEKNLKDIPPDKWAEYIYRMQLRVPVKKARIRDKEKQIPLENTIGNPLTSSVEVHEAYLFPEPFPPAKQLEFETVENEKIIINIARKPYNSFEEILFTNIDFPALNIRFVLSDDLKNSKVTYTVTPKKAKSVSDALTAIHLFNGLYQGTVKINGKKITKPVISAPDFDIKQLENVTEFWTVAKKLEEKLGITFSPSADFPMEDVEFFEQLNNCLLNNKSVVWEHPFDHFHVKGIAIENGKFEDFLEKESVEYAFLEGPIHATLLGAEFELYSQTRLSNMVITNIIWDDNEKISGEIYVSDPIESKWKLYRKYMSKEQKDVLLKKCEE